MSKVIRCRECREVKDWHDFRKRTWDGSAICRECEDNGHGLWNEYDPWREEERRERLGLNYDWEREEIRQDVGGGWRGGRFRGTRGPGQRLRDGAGNETSLGRRGVGMALKVVSQGGSRFVTRQRSTAA